MKIARIKKYPKDHPNAYARVVRVNHTKETMDVSNMNMPFQGTFAGKTFTFDEIELVDHIGQGSE